jgi:methionyl aminopeptidase
MDTAYISAADAPMRNIGLVKLYGPEGFAGMRKAGHLAASCLDMLHPHVKAGVTTEAIDTLAREFVLDNGGTPACIGYRGYQHTVCTSVNHVVCHGIPSDKMLKDGDILNIDVTVIVDGWHGDTSRMWAVGKVNRKAERLLDITYECLMRAIGVVKPGATLGDIGWAVQEYAEAQRCGIVEDFCGHGLGRVFHDTPNILHTGKPGDGLVLKPGMFFTIEPMINDGRKDLKVLGDGWTAVTRDKSLSAQFEHSIGVTEDACEIFTKSPAGLDAPHTHV